MHMRFGHLLCSGNQQLFTRIIQDRLHKRQAAVLQALEGLNRPNQKIVTGTFDKRKRFRPFHITVSMGAYLPNRNPFLVPNTHDENVH